MRLEDYLVETTLMAKPLKELEDDMKDWFTTIGKVLDREGWFINDEDMVTILNAVTKKDGVEFIMTDMKSAGRYMSGAQFGGEPVERGVFFQVWLIPGFARFFQRFGKQHKRKDFTSITRNDFMRELYDIFAHEGVHAEQMLRMSDSGNLDKIMQSQEDSHFSTNKRKYYADKREIEAYALQSAVEFARLRRSNVYEVYEMLFKDSDTKVWKRFLKKLSFYKKEVKKSGVLLQLGKLVNMRKK